jgi:hypothetical protein
MAAQINIDFTRGSVGSQYYIHSSVHASPPTTPAELVKCLLIRIATSTQPEQLMRVCTVAEVETVTNVEPPLTRLNCTGIFSGMLSPTAGDVIIIYSNDLWTLMGYPGPLTGTIHSVNISGQYVILDFALPAYAEDLAVTVPSTFGHGPLYGTDGVATRDVSTQTYFRINDYWSVFDELPDAINKLLSLEAEAQALVTSFNDYGTEFAGTDHEVYT